MFACSVPAAAAPPIQPPQTTTIEPALPPAPLATFSEVKRARVSIVSPPPADETAPTPVSSVANAITSDLHKCQCERPLKLSSPLAVAPVYPLGPVSALLPTAGDASASLELKPLPDGTGTSLVCASLGWTSFVPSVVCAVTITGDCITVGCSDSAVHFLSCAGVPLTPAASKECLCVC